MKTKRIKRLLQVFLSFALMGATAICCDVTAAAATTYSDITVTRVANIPTAKLYNSEGDVAEKFSTVGGIAVGKAAHSMFVFKSNSTERDAALYYYPSISEPTEYHIYRVNYAGHANAMTIDRTNIFVAGWADGEGDAGNTYNNWIVKIPRSVVSQMVTDKKPNLAFLPEKAEDTEGISVMFPKKKQIVNNTVTYVNYTEDIKSITKYNADGKFLIGYDLGNENGYDCCYTTAELVKHNGETLFVVSEDPADMFIVKNTLAYKNAMGQAMCYKENVGLFIPKYYGAPSKREETPSPYRCKTKNVILWADIDSPAQSTKTVGNNSYRYYTDPDKIKIDQTNAKYGTHTMYSKFEIESIAFTKYDTMLAGFNVENTESYETAYESDKHKSPPGDGVFKIKHGNNQNFE